MLNIAICIIAIPFVALVVHTLLSARLPRRGDWFATGAVFVSLGLAFWLFIRMFLSPTAIYINFRIDWLNLGTRVIPAGILLDHLTIVMLVVVTLVSALVYLFSIGYMHGDVRYGRYFSYLLLFTTSMLGLVLANNLLVLYIFWELVGLSSYLLIGHWFERDAAAKAALKAFITTRIGDVGMFFAILLIYFHLGTFDYEAVFQAVATGTLAGKIRMLAGLGIFFGAMGKSAQFPLHVWLPDAMEGPTPISALIHAATMVAAGVYLVGRLFLIFDPTVLLIIAYVGCFTAVIGATMAVVMDDMKKVLAYSTISQLGYMMLGLGVGSYVAGLFHLTTHASFKALLFLGSGSVIHALGTQSMREMGGLRRKMPVTTVTFLIGTLAISGCPFFAGFYSKDAIIGSALAFGLHHPQHLVLFVLSVLTAGLTAFYMFRLFFKTFAGAPRDQEKFHHAHESPLVMTIPLVILAFFSMVSGYGGWFQKYNPLPEISTYRTQVAAEQARHALSVPSSSLETNGHTAAVKPLAEHEREGMAEEKELEHRAHLGAMVGSTVLGALGVLLAYLMFYKRRLSSAALIKRFRPIYTMLSNKYYMDDFYHAVLVRTLHAVVWVIGAFDKYVIDGLVNFSGLATRFASWCIGVFDNIAVDGAVNRTAWTTGFLGEILSFTQTGRIRNYLLFIVLGIVTLVTVFVFIK
jgi:NADH-quinone oxidoreductase subunit L